MHPCKPYQFIVVVYSSKNKYNFIIFFNLKQACWIINHILVLLTCRIKTKLVKLEKFSNKSYSDKY